MTVGIIFGATLLPWKYKDDPNSGYQHGYLVRDMRTPGFESMRAPEGLTLFHG